MPAADQKGHDVEPMRSPVRFGLVPLAALVFDLHMHIGAEPLTTNCERPNSRQAVQHRIAGELRDDETCVIRDGTVSEVIPYVGAGPRNVLWRSSECG